MAMRHWLAGVLARENPALFNQLPESFKIGLPLPERPAAMARCGVRAPRGRRIPAALPPVTSQRDVPTNPGHSPG